MQTNRTPLLPDGGIDYRRLDKELGIVKMATFTSRHSAFLGPLGCGLRVIWDETVKTACTDGVVIRWNPHLFCRVRRTTRKFILKHEVWHPAFLDMLRRGNRDPRRWNIACDHRINLICKDEGDTWDDLGFRIHCDERYRGLTAEQIYDLLPEDLPGPDPETGEDEGEGFDGDILEPASEEVRQEVQQKVVNAKVQAEKADPGSVPGEIRDVVEDFLRPRVPWKQVLHRWVMALANQDHSYSKRNRRFRDVCLPSLVDCEGGLDEVYMFADRSGSVDDDETRVFFSEVRYLKDAYRIRKLTLVQFDEEILRADVFGEGDDFTRIELEGGGGTDLDPVRDHVIRNQPTAVIVFSDLFCRPMDKLPGRLAQLPWIWVCVNNRDAEVRFGKLVHINV